MQIDWFTLIAQIINFLILVFLLKHFLYGPITRAMEERQQTIADRMEEAEKKRQQAEEEARAYHERRKELQDRTQEMLARAAEEAEARRKQLISEAREEAEHTQAEWREAIERDKKAFLRDLRERAGEQVCAIATRALKDLATQDLQDHVVDVFIRRIQELDEAQRTAFAASIRDTGGEILVRSAFEIPQGARRRIEDAIREHIAADGEMRFEVSEELICGLELRSDGLKVAWSVAGYLDALESKLSQVLVQEAGTTT